MEPITAADVQTAYAAVLRVDLNPTVAAAIADSINNGNQTFDEYVAGLINSASTSTVPTVAVLAFYEGLVPSEARVDSVAAFSQSQFASYAAKGVGNPALGPYEAIGYALALDPANGFDAKYGPDVFSTSEAFISAVYVQVFGQLPSGGALTNLLSQLEGEKSLTQAYLNDGISAEQAVLLARGAVLGQIIGYAFQPDPDNLVPDSPLVGQVTDFLENAATGDTTGFGVALPAPQPADGQIFTLTAGTDTILGQPGNLIGSKGTVDNSGNDTILAGVSSVGQDVVNNLGSGDVVDGGAGTDVLKIISQSNVALVPTLSNVERVEIQGLATTNLNLINNTEGSVGEIVNARSTNQVNVTNVQAEAIVSAIDTNSRIDVTFAPDVTFGGDVTLRVNGAGVVANTAEMNINAADAVNITTLNVESTGVASFLDFDIDTADGGGDTAVLTTLNISGNADLVLRERNAGGDSETDFITTVAVTSTAKVDLDLSDNDVDVTVTAADGGLKMIIGDGDNTITTGAGVDVITVGNGNNTVVLGAGNDKLIAGTTLTTADSFDGGDGIDELSLEIGSAAALSVTAAASAAFSNFEKLELTGSVAALTTRTVNLANLDAISDVTVDVDTAVGAGTNETATVTFESLLSGQSVTVAGRSITATGGNLTAVQVANAFETGVNNGFAVVGGALVGYNVAASPGTAVSVLTATTAGNKANVDPTVNPATAPGTPTVTDNVTSYVAPVAAKTETAKVTFSGFAQGADVITIGGIAVNLADGDNVNDIATKATTALNGNAGFFANWTTVNNFDGSITITSTTSGVNQADLTASVTTNAGNDAAPGVVLVTTDGAPAVAESFETQTVLFTALKSGQSETVGGRTITALSDRTAEQVSDAFFAGGDADTSITGLFTPGWTLSDPVNGDATLTLTATTAGDKAAVTSSAANSAAPVDPAAVIVDGDLTSGGGAIVINNLAGSGTVRLAGDNDGSITVNLTSTNGTADVVNVVLEAANTGGGSTIIAGVETINVTTEALLGQSTFGLVAADVKAMTVTGVSGVNFTNTFAKLATFDASLVTGGAGIGDVNVTTTVATAATFTGGAGDDTLTTGAGKDIIVGGAGDDVITGNGNADTLTGGAGADRFAYFAESDSQGATVDTITDFVSGTDTIDISAFANGGGFYDGEAANLGQVLTGLSGAADGNTRALLDTSTSTLYIDVDGDGVLNDSDMAIQLTGVTTLKADGSDFVGFLG